MNLQKLGKIIYEYRVKTGMSQREFSRRCGISNASISLLEKGGINPRTDRPFRLEYVTCYKLAQALGMNIEELFDRAGITVQKDSISEDEITLLSILHRLDSFGRQKLIERANELLILQGSNNLAGNSPRLR